MLISLKWLNNYIDIGYNAEKIASDLIKIGHEVEKIEYQGANLDNVVVGKIIEKGKHPDSDKLSLCKVDVKGEILQIICGAPNHKENDKVAVAKINAVLPGNFKIKKSKIRGVESQGMMCSGAELKVSDEKEGILILKKNAKIGQSIKEYLNLDDVILHLEITPNRSDCFSYIGIARELCAYYDKKLNIPSVIKHDKVNKNLDLNLTVEDFNDCSKYSIGIIKGIKLGNSPDWLKEKLITIGLKPINNIVDITNYLLFETGQPLHAFDFDKITGSTINVRRAKSNEKILPLFGKEFELSNQSLVIADLQKSIAIAGIIGGSNSEIDENTVDIAIECAHFDKDLIRKSSNFFGISTDASYRFERGIDKSNINYVLNRAIDLVLKLAGGTFVGIKDYDKIAKNSKEILLNLNFLEKLLRANIIDTEVISILTKLKFSVTRIDANQYKVKVPSYRNDINIEVDLIEEVARMYGFDNIKAIDPTLKIQSGHQDKMVKDIFNIKNKLAKMGLNEVINYSFIPSLAPDIINYDIKSENQMFLQNPISDDMVLLRPTLVYSILKNITDNLKQGSNYLKLFEVGKSFIKQELSPIETVKVAFAISGIDKKTIWNLKERELDFYDLKGLVEKFLDENQIKSFMLKRSTEKMFHPGISADVFIGKEKIGYFGMINKDIVDKFSVNNSIFIAEFDFDKLNKYKKKTEIFKGISKFPTVKRDLALIVEKDKFVNDIITEVKKSSKYIIDINLFDVYIDEKRDANKKSVGFNIIFNSDQKTLTDVEINEIMTKLISKLEKKHDATLREM